ncbi:MAG TPA: ABC transporter permease subunit [Planctomycetota bacterium]|nr:ABC transporter permease subunit [Planctomycetota bacterium]HQA99846.1 ABC transporter permease subunit [Planctomycetota bacterium]
MKKITLSALLYIILFGGAMLVLLPLFWMILTACKQPGQALEFRFLPDSVLESEIQAVYQPITDKAIVIFEFNPNDCPDIPVSSISVAGTFNGWNSSANPMVKDNNIWRTTLHNIDIGNHEYKFVVNGNNWIQDPANKPTTTDNCLITLQAGLNQNKKTLANQTYIQGKTLFIAIDRGNAESLQVKIFNQTINLLKNDQNYFTATVEIPETEIGKHAITYTILEPQNFWDGMKKIYTFNNFKKVLYNRDFPFGQFFLNSLVVAAGTALLTVILCTMAGYAFAKKNFFMKKQLFAMLLSTMMIPGMIFMVPQFAIVNHFNWINTYQAMIVPHLANIFGLFLLKQYISTIPNSLFEAANIDGANELQIFKIIIIPLSLPIMVTLFLLTFVGQWGNFLWQLIVNTPDSTYRTLPVGMALFRGQYGQDWEMMMAGACFSIIPIAILFLIAQRFFIEGMTTGAVKE